MTPSINCTNLIIQFEGYGKQVEGSTDAIAYPDPATGGEPWTIGYGSTYHHILGRKVRKGDRITQAEARKLLETDISKFASSVSALLDVEVNQNQFDALVSFTYNVGIGNFKGSSIRRLINDGKFAQAASVFDRWVNANGKRLNGLVRRRAAEKKLFLTPVPSLS